MQEAILAKGLDFQWIEVKGPREVVNLTAQVLGRSDGVRHGEEAAGCSSSVGVDPIL